MKKILVVLSLICFVAVNVTNAQTSAQAGKTEKKEAVTATSTTECAHATSHACCKKGSAKACTPEEKAKCDANKAKADASGKTESKSAIKN